MMKKIFALAIFAALIVPATAAAHTVQELDTDGDGEVDTYVVIGEDGGHTGVYNEDNGCDGFQSHESDCDGDGELEPADSSVASTDDL